jgi:hypothetical protein
MEQPTTIHEGRAGAREPETTVDEACACPRCLRQLPASLRVALLLIAGALALLVVLLPLGLAALVSFGPQWFRGEGFTAACVSCAFAGVWAIVILCACYEHAKPRS